MWCTRQPVFSFRDRQPLVTTRRYSAAGWKQVGPSTQRYRILLVAAGVASCSPPDGGDKKSSKKDLGEAKEFWRDYVMEQTHARRHGKRGLDGDQVTTVLSAVSVRGRVPRMLALARLFAATGGVTESRASDAGPNVLRQSTRRAIRPRKRLERC